MSRRERVRALLADVVWRSALLMLAAAAIVALAFATGLSERAAGHVDHDSPTVGRQGHGAHVVRDESDFLVSMIIHHQEAVASAQAMLEITERDEVRQLARSIVHEWSAEIEQLRSWLAAGHPERVATEGGAGAAVAVSAFEPMMRPFVGLRPAEAEEVFVSDLIRHHEAAMAMAESYLGLPGPKAPEVVAFARETLRIASAEIRVLELLLQMWGVAPVDHGSH